MQSFEPAGTVLTQAPGGGARLQLGSAVTLGVSDGKGEPIVIPRLTGLTEAQAVHELEKRGLVAAIEHVQVDDGHLDGIVVDQIPIGDGSKVVDVGATVTIYVGTFEGNGNGNGGGNGGGNGERRRERERWWGRRWWRCLAGAAARVAPATSALALSPRGARAPSAGPPNRPPCPWPRPSPRP